MRVRTMSLFFSSRRRHTRFDCDWSSDVCSSDLGNVREWTQDCYHVSLDGIPTDGSAWLTECARGGEGNVFRGGSFMGGADQLRSASRQATIGREINMGFRIARELD